MLTDIRAESYHQKHGLLPEAGRLQTRTEPETHRDAALSRCVADAAVEVVVEIAVVEFCGVETSCAGTETNH